MAVPTSYTYDTFADFLKDEVLRDSAESLGYGDYVPAIPEIAARIIIRASGTPPYNFTTGIPIIEPGFSKPVGTVLAFSNGVSRTLDAAITPTSTTMNVTVGGGAFQPGDYAKVVIRAAVARVRNDFYDSVTDAVLEQMGLTIGDVDATNVGLFRQYGRVEMLRRVMQNVATNYDYQVASASSQNQTDVYKKVLQMFQFEQNRLSSMLTATSGITPKLPEEANSASGEVVVVW